MLYLAQVQNQAVLGEASLELLACQNADDTWAILAEKKCLDISDRLWYTAKSLPN